MYYEELTKSFIDEYKNVFRDQGCNSESIKKWFENLAKTNPEAATELDSILFARNRNNNHLKIQGEKHFNEHLFKIPSYLADERLSLSDVDILEISLRFICLYDNKKLGFAEKVLPLLIIFLCLKARHFISISSISYQCGMFSLSFDSNTPFAKNEIIELLNNNVEFSFFKFIKLIEAHEIILALNETFCIDTTDGYWHVFNITLDEEAQKNCTVLTKYWLSCFGELTKRELKELMGLKEYSDRALNDSLSKLIKNGDAIQMGNTTSPNAKYKYIGKDSVFLDS